MNFEEFERENGGGNRPKVCEPCTPHPAAVPGSLMLVEVAPGVSEYMFLTTDGRMVPAEDY